MHPDLIAAMASAKAISLHCTKGTSDKIYNIQLRPRMNAATGTTIEWIVNAQNGRRGYGLTKRQKYVGNSINVARRIYDELVTEKTDKNGYVVVPNREESEALDAEIKSARSAPSTVGGAKLPPWDGIDKGYKETVEFIREHSATGARINLLFAQALAEVAYGCAEGIPEALVVLKRPNADKAILPYLSTEAVQQFAKVGCRFSDCIEYFKVTLNISAE